MSEQARGRIGFAFALGHGHATQFLNFQEAWQNEQGLTPEWIGLSGSKPGAPWGKLGFVPRGVRYRESEVWHFQKRLSESDAWSALFIASENTALIRVTRKFPSYLYTDLTPSLKISLAPWYSAQLAKNPVLQAFKTMAHGRVYRSARGVFTMSRWAARGVEGDYGVAPNRIHVALPGANLRSWHYVDRSDRSGPVRLLMVGGQFRLKGGPMLLDWARRTQVKDFEIDIVTWPGELPSSITDKLANHTTDGYTCVDLGPELPMVRVHCGLRSNNPALLELFQRADIFVLPTQADGSSIASLEAMATGLPVVVGGVGGIPELIEQGKTGFLIGPRDEAALARHLEQLISDRALRRTIGQAARAACERQFNVDRQLRDILAVIAKDGYV